MSDALVGVCQEHLMNVAIFTSQYDLMYAMGRLQEFYENPTLAGRFFTRQELQDFQYDYYVRWNGCNVPARVLPSFLQLFGENLDAQERVLLPLLRQEKYLVGTHVGQGSAMIDALQHERAHALYELSDEYRRFASPQAWLQPGTIEEAYCRLASMGYGARVKDDEIQAYVVSGWNKLDILETVEVREMRRAVTALLQRKAKGTE